jgi:hypothetical protein
MALRQTRSTKELKVAVKISELVNDLTLDLDQVGVYLATSNHITYRRVMDIAEAAQWEKEQKYLEITDDNYLF